MEALRHWALVLCISAVLASALQSALPEKGTFSVIKLVLSLYILVTLVSPLRQFGIGDLELSLPQVQETAAAADLSAEVLAQAASSLERTLGSALAADGLRAEKVAVTLALDEKNNAVLTAVTVTSEEDGSRIRSSVERALSCSVPLTVVRQNGTAS